MTTALNALDAIADAARKAPANTATREPSYIPYADDQPVQTRRIGAPVTLTRHADDDAATPIPYVQSGKSRRVDAAAAIIGVWLLDPSLLSAKGKKYRETLCGK